MISFMAWLMEVEGWFDTYYDIGHSGGEGDALWWINDAGNIEVSFLRQGEGAEVRHLKRMKEGWYGRYDKNRNKGI